MRTNPAMIQIVIAIFICGLHNSIKALPAASTNDANIPGVAAALSVPETTPPYHISLRHDGPHSCGASLVVVKGQQVVLTTADCVKEGSADNYTVVAGVKDLLWENGLEQTRQVSRINIHENYSASSRANNIAILNIESPFELNDDVAPIPLPTQGQATTGDVHISGWGFDPLRDGYFTNLQRVIPVVGDDYCSKLYAPFLVPITSSMLCAGQKGVSVFCIFEYGSPVRAVNGDYLAGIVNLREGCASSKFPGINTEVSHFVDWINTKVDNSADLGQTSSWSNIWASLIRPLKISFTPK